MECILLYILYIGSLQIFYLFQIIPSTLGVQQYRNTLFISHTGFLHCLEATRKLEAQADARNREVLSFRYPPQQQTTVAFQEENRAYREQFSNQVIYHTSTT